MPYPQRLKPSIKNAPDCVPSLFDLIIPWQWLTLSLPKPFFKSFFWHERGKQGRQQHCASDFALQRSANAVKRQMRDLSHNNGTTHLFTSRKLEQDLKPREIQPPIVNRQCVVYSFTCDLCDSDYVGFTARHLHQRIVPF